MNRNGRVGVIAMILLLASCQGDDSGGGPVGLSQDLVLGEPLMSAAIVPPGDICPQGGTVIKMGVDKNQNRRLDETDEINEVTETFPVCNGVDGGNQGDLQIIPEAAGANCSEGGVGVFKGNELLQYICNGEDAERTLMEVRPLASGPDSECTYGGEKLVWGQDLEPFDGVLQDEELVDSLLDCQAPPQLCQANLIVRSAADVEELGQCLGRFEGDIVVDGAITSLDGLSQIHTITGSLELQESELEDFSSLTSLKEVKGDLVISKDNLQLTSFAGLQSLERIGGRFRIEVLNGPSSFLQLDSLQDIGQLELADDASITGFLGLENLTRLKITRISPKIESLGGLEELLRLEVDEFKLGGDGNTKINDLTPLSKLSYLGDLQIEAGTAIDNNDMIALSNVEEVGDIAIFSASGISDLSTISPKKLLGGFKLQGQGAMEGLRGFFRNITNIPGHVTITDQQNLQDLSFLGQVTSIGGSLTIQNNPSVTSFKGLENLKSVGLTQVGNDELGMNIIGGPTVLCGLTGLENFRGLLFGADGSTNDWASALTLPQSPCE